MASTPEGRVKTDIKRYLEAMGFWRAGSCRPPRDVTGWFFMPVNNGMGVAGIPDFICCWEGRFFAIEAKAPNGDPTANQLQRHEEIRTAKGLVLLANSVSVVSEFVTTFMQNASPGAS
jgi:hypothetical protein